MKNVRVVMTISQNNYSEKIEILKKGKEREKDQFSM